MPTPPLLNLDALALSDWGRGERYAAQLGALGQQLGAQQLGCRLVVLPPGKAAWPYHRHHANEELFVILSGTGTLRYDDQLYPVRAGDVLCAPAGGGAHQLQNTSTAELRYLAISTMREPDIIEYPDSQKLGCFAGSAPGGDVQQRRLSVFLRQDAAVDYWQDEA